MHRMQHTLQFAQTAFMSGIYFTYLIMDAATSLEQSIKKFKRSISRFIYLSIVKIHISQYPDELFSQHGGKLVKSQNH